MIKTKEVFAQGFYIFESRATANSNYIENISEAKLLMRLAKMYLKEYVNIKDYLINRHGWQMAVSLKTEATIRKAYDRKVEARFGSEHKQASQIEIWRIISEAVRLFISKYVQQINFRRKREGTLVKTSYERSYFSSLTEAKAHLGNLRRELIVMYQRKKKYRGLKSHYQIGRKAEKGSIFLCSKEIGVSDRRKSIAGREVGTYLRDLVLPDVIKSTRLAHFFCDSKIVFANSKYPKLE